MLIDSAKELSISPSGLTRTGRLRLIIFVDETSDKARQKIESFAKLALA